MHVSRYMTQKLVTARPEDGVRQTFFRMREKSIRHMPVVDASGALVGFITDRDLRRPDWVDEAVDVAHVYQLDDSLQVQDLMTTHVIAVHAADNISKAATILRERRWGALPVVNKNDELIGIISAVDLLGALVDVLAAVDD